MPVPVGVAVPSSSVFPAPFPPNVAWEGNGGEQGIYDIYAAQVPPLAEPRPDCILSGIDINDNPGPGVVCCPCNVRGEVVS